MPTRYRDECLERQHSGVAEGADWRAVGREWGVEDLHKARRFVPVRPEGISPRHERTTYSRERFVCPRCGGPKSRKATACTGCVHGIRSND